MSLLTTLNRVPYTADGVQTSFAYSFKIFLTTDLQVYDDANLLSSGYTVTGAGTENGGNVVFSVAPLSGHKILILRVEPETQATVLPSSGPFPAKSVENMSDKLTMLVQQLVEVDKRTLKLLVTSLLTNLTVPDPVAGNFLRWKAGLDGLENATPIASGAIGLPVGITDGGTGAITISAARANLSTRATIASAATLLVTAESYFDVTGSVGITLLATQPAGVRVLLRFSGAPLITHHATDLILLGGVNYQAAAGDIMEFTSEGGGDWRETFRRPVTGATSANFYRGDGLWSAPVIVPERGYIFGLTLSNNGADAVNDLDIAAGEAASEDATPERMAGSALTKQIDATWAVGTNQGMRDSNDNLTGAKTFHIFLIKRTDTGVVDVFASTSLTPTLPASYTKKRRIGSLSWDGSTIRRFYQRGDWFWWKDPPQDIDVTNPGTAAVTRTLTAPSGIRTIAFVNVWYNAGGSGTPRVYLSPLDVDDEAPVINGGPLHQMSYDDTAGGSNGIGTGPVSVETNTSSQIRSRVTPSDANTILRIVTLGYIDARGRES